MHRALFAIRLWVLHVYMEQLELIAGTDLVLLAG